MLPHSLNKQLRRSTVRGGFPLRLKVGAVAVNKLIDFGGYLLAPLSATGTYIIAQASSVSNTEGITMAGLAGALVLWLTTKHSKSLDDNAAATRELAKSVEADRGEQREFRQIVLTQNAAILEELRKRT